MEDGFVADWLFWKFDIHRLEQLPSGQFSRNLTKNQGAILARIPMGYNIVSCLSDYNEQPAVRGANTLVG